MFLIIVETVIMMEILAVSTICVKFNRGISCIHLDSKKI